MDTLPDHLKEGLDIVLVGLNPSTYSVTEGHYFANPRNRFWAAFNRSGLVDGKISSDLDSSLLERGIGFTDLVKRPTSGASQLSAADYRLGAPSLREKLLGFQPLVVCFNGLMAYGGYLKYGEGIVAKPELGLQAATIGASSVYVVPNPSPANARFSADDLAGWYRRLKSLLDQIKGRP